MADDFPALATPGRWLRNKKDGTIESYAYANAPAPGISNFMGGYLNAPASKIG